MLAISSVIVRIPLALFGVVFLMQNIENAATTTPHAFTLFVGVFWLIVSFLPLSPGMTLAGMGFLGLMESPSPEVRASLRWVAALCTHVLNPILIVGICLVLVGIMGDPVIEDDLKAGEYGFYVVGPLLVIFGALLRFRVSLAWLGRWATELWRFLANKDLGFLAVLIPALVALLTYAVLSEILAAEKWARPLAGSRSCCAPVNP